MHLRIGHLYPEHLNLYGDRGNVIALAKRAEWRSIGVMVESIGLNEEVDLSQYDLLFIGGGQDRDQTLIAKDLKLVKGNSLLDAADGGVPLLAVCGGYQLLGKYYRLSTGEEVEGLGLLDISTEAGAKRLIGNIVLETELTGEKQTVVGFENHSGRTFLGSEVKPLGKVLSGSGNNGEDGFEGSVQGNIIGTYIHGSLLPKNPKITDWLLTRALERKFGQVQLQELNDNLEESAHQVMVKRSLS